MGACRSYSARVFLELLMGTDVDNLGLLVQETYVLTDAQWFLLIGGLLLVMGLTSAALKRLPITSAIVYLAVGLLLGPTVLNVFHFNPLKQ